MAVFHSPVRRLGALLALLLTAGTVLFVGLGSSVEAVAKQPKGLDHFLCYSVNELPGASGFEIPPGVILENQFTSASGFEPTIGPEPVLHCNPALKQVGSTTYPITNPNAHSLCFPASSSVAQPTFTVKVTNQFGSAKLKTGQPALLCLPSWKSLTGPPNMTPNQPPGLSHFTCYSVSYLNAKQHYTIPSNVLAQDEFASAPVPIQIGAPVLLCVPTTKIVNGATFPAINPTAHLLCFNVSPTPKVSPIWDENQFGTGALQVNTTVLFCVPSLKKIVK